MIPPLALLPESSSTLAGGCMHSEYTHTLAVQLEPQCLFEGQAKTGSFAGCVDQVLPDHACKLRLCAKDLPLGRRTFHLEGVTCK